MSHPPPRTGSLSPLASPHSSGDRALASGARCEGSNPSGGALTCSSALSGSCRCVLALGVTAGGNGGPHVPRARGMQVHQPPLACWPRVGPELASSLPVGAGRGCLLAVSYARPSASLSVGHGPGRRDVASPATVSRISRHAGLVFSR